MMRHIYRLLYLSIVLHFLRAMAARWADCLSGKYNLYVEKCFRKDRTFTVLVASFPDRSVIEKMSQYLTKHHWDNVIAANGCYAPRRPCEIIPLTDPVMKTLFNKEDLAELTGALRYLASV